ncbi:hypothetical protein Tco_0269502 [Tanacetum coccineum]
MSPLTAVVDRWSGDDARTVYEVVSMRNDLEAHVSRTDWWLQLETPKALIQAWDKFLEIKHAQSEEVQELLSKLLQDLQSINEELAEYINTPSWNLPTSSYDDDDDEYSFATQEYLMTCSTFSDELAHIDPIPPGIEEADFDLEEEIRLVENLSLPLHLLSPLRIVTLKWRRSIYFLLPTTRCLRVLRMTTMTQKGISVFLKNCLAMTPFLFSKLSHLTLIILMNLDHFNEPSSPRPPPEPPDVKICFNVVPDTTMKNDFDELHEDECFDLEGGEIDVFANVEDDDYFPFTFIIRIFLPYLTYPEVSPFLLSSGSEDTIFDPGISTFHFSSFKPVAYENPMVIFPFFCFCPKDKGIRGESS